MVYYTYAYLREDGTPYYIGKGKDRRAWQKHRNGIRPQNYNRILILKKNLTEEQAHQHEKYLVFVYGRKEHGGLLINMTDGGEGITGYRHTEETKRICGLSTFGRKEPEEDKKRRLELSRLGRERRTPERVVEVANNMLESNSQRTEVVVEGITFLSTNQAARWAMDIYGVSRNTAIRYIKEGRSFTDKKQINRNYSGTHRSSAVL